MALLLNHPRVHAVRHCRHGHPSLLLLRLVACLLLAPSLPLFGSAVTVVTRLPGFNGPLPFYLETGYVGVEEATGTELFYYFVESERSPRTDNMILWLTGRPRCSVFSGLGFEIGPIKFVLEPYTPYNGSLPKLTYNPYSWTQMASILFVDSPVGSGFSYARDPKGYDVGDYSSSWQILIFLKEWFSDHPQYLSNPFYIGGDSYSGKVTPLIAQYILEGIEQSLQPRINLKGYLIGNHVTDPWFDKNYIIPASHGFGIISHQLYGAAAEHCKGDYVMPANEICAGVLHTINKLISEIAEGHILYKLCGLATPKPADGDDSIRRFLSEESTGLSAPPGYPGLDCFTYGYYYYLAYFWMNDNATRDALGIKEVYNNICKQFDLCDCEGCWPYYSRVSAKRKFRTGSKVAGQQASLTSWSDHSGECSLLSNCTVVLNDGSSISFFCYSNHSVFLPSNNLLIKLYRFGLEELFLPMGHG